MTRAGETVLLRYFHGGRPVGALPTRAAGRDGRALWLAGGTPVVWPAVGGRPVGEIPSEERFSQPWESVERPWTGDGVLILGCPGRAYSIWLFWDTGDFARWYVNLEDPRRASRLGFDTADHELDIWVEANGSWRWKDERELELAVELGSFNAEQAAAIRAEGERVLEEWPFPTGWEDWHADPSWTTPQVPVDWDA